MKKKINSLKTIGIIGGMSYESSRIYEDIINEAIRSEMGGLNSIKCVSCCFNFNEIAGLQHAGEWDILRNMMINAAKTLESAGADFIIICTNTMHIFINDMTESVHIPILSIVETTAEKIHEKNVKKVALLGTRFTMEKEFYKEVLERIHGLEVVIPNKEERIIIDDIIYKELCEGIKKLPSKEALQAIVKNLQKRGAEGVILGCTELPLLLKQEDVDVPLFDTMTIHAKAAAKLAMENQHETT